MLGFSVAFFKERRLIKRPSIQIQQRWILQPSLPLIKLRLRHPHQIRVIAARYHGVHILLKPSRRDRARNLTMLVPVMHRLRPNVPPRRLPHPGEEIRRGLVGLEVLVRVVRVVVRMRLFEVDVDVG